MENIINTTEKNIGIYTSLYLTQSMTFIYRQLIGISSSFKPTVFTTKTQNLDLFPFSPIYEFTDVNKLYQSKNLIGKVYRFLIRNVTGKYIYLNMVQRSQRLVIIQNKDLKLIHAHFGPCGLEMLPLARRLDIPLVTTIHGYDASLLLKNRIYKANLVDLSTYSKIICISKTMATKLKTIGVRSSSIFVHYIGAPVDDFYYVKRLPLKEKVRLKKRLEFLQVSNFVEKKGHRYSIEAFCKFLESYPNSRLTFVGDGPLRKGIEAHCNQLGIQDKVRFMGYLSKNDVIPLMHQSDIFLHHSITSRQGDEEGIPTVIMEAMATGLVVVSTFHAGIPELIDDEINGFLVPERDVHEYVRKLLHLLNVNGEIGFRASEKIKSSFSLENQNEKLIDVYNGIINGR